LIRKRALSKEPRGMLLTAQVRRGTAIWHEIRDYRGKRQASKGGKKKQIQQPRQGRTVHPRQTQVCPKICCPPCYRGYMAA